MAVLFGMAKISFLCDDHDEDKDYVFDVRQEIKNGILSTDLKREYATKKDKKNNRKIHHGS